jgi:starvation-inducible outer membrane lipoprotein
MKYIICTFALILSSCASMEQQCQTEVNESRWNSYEACMRFKQEQNQQSAAALQNAGQAIRPPASTTPQRIDMQCQSGCLQAGGMMAFCNSKCAY